MTPRARRGAPTTPPVSHQLTTAGLRQITFTAVTCREICQATAGNGRAVIVLDDNVNTGSTTYVVTLTYDVKKSSSSRPSATMPSVRVPSGGVSANSSPADVMALQRALADLGLYKGPIDGIFRKTEAAVRAFQKSKGLTVDGIVSSKTAAQLNAAVEAN